jgi:hypothetical protein
MITSHAPMLELADSILDRTALIVDRPRQIDHYIDYFGGGMERAGRAETASAVHQAR